MSDTASASTVSAKSVPTETAPSHQPYVPDSTTIPELTWSAVLLGSVLGILFGASSLYLFLKVGMTVSASIPVAVLAITVFRWLSRAFGTRRATILENNIVQTAGSAGESIAFGVGAAMPALMLLGYELEWTRVMLVAVLGGLLGILMMIPLRRAFVVKQHKVLKYPEGTACAKVLVAGEQGGSNARMVFQGFGIGFLYQVMMQAFKLWSDAPSKAITGISGYNKAELGLEPSPALLGVGYILGFRISAIMVGWRVAGLVVVDSRDCLVRRPANRVASASHCVDSGHERRPAVEFVRPLYRCRSRGRRGHYQHVAGDADDLRLGAERAPGPTRERQDGWEILAMPSNAPIAICRCRLCCSVRWPWWV